MAFQNISLNTLNSLKPIVVENRAAWGTLQAELMNITSVNIIARKGFGKLIQSYGTTNGFDMPGDTSIDGTNPLTMQQWNLMPLMFQKVVSLSFMDLAAARSDDSAFGSILDNVMRSIWATQAQWICFSVFGQTGYNELGQVDKVGIDYITLVDNGAIKKLITLNQNKLQFATTVDTGALLENGATLTVAYVDPDSNTIYFTSPTSAITGLTAGCWIFYEGTRENSLTPSKTGISSIPAYLGTSGGVLNGVNRDIQPTLTNGYRVSAKPYDAVTNPTPLITALGQATMWSQFANSNVRTVYMSSNNHLRLQQELKNSLNYYQGINGTSPTHGAPSVGFSDIGIDTKKNGISIGGLHMDTVVNDYLNDDKIYGLGDKSYSLFFGCTEPTNSKDNYMGATGSWDEQRIRQYNTTNFNNGTKLSSDYVLDVFNSYSIIPDGNQGIKINPRIICNGLLDNPSKCFSIDVTALA